jgi:hypothetical protein
MTEYSVARSGLPVCDMLRFGALLAAAWTAALLQQADGCETGAWAAGSCHIRTRGPEGDPCTAGHDVEAKDALKRVSSRPEVSGHNKVAQLSRNPARRRASM